MKARTQLNYFAWHNKQVKLLVVYTDILYKSFMSQRKKIKFIKKTR